MANFNRLRYFLDDVERRHRDGETCSIVLSEKLGISLRTLRRWTQYGDGPPISGRWGNVPVYRLSGLRRWLDSRPVRWLLAHSQKPQKRRRW